MSAHQSVINSLLKVIKKKKYRIDSHSTHIQINNIHILDSTDVDEIKRRPKEANKARIKQNGRRMK